MNKLYVFVLFLAMSAMSFSCSADEDVAVYPESVVISDTEVTVVKGDSYFLSASVYPKGAEYDSIIWKSEDNSILTVNSLGRIEGVNVGKTKVFAEAGGVIGECIVSVVDKPVSEIVISGDNAMEVGSEQKLLAHVFPSDAENYSLSWESSDDNVLKVSGDGMVSAVSEGHAVITVSCGEVSGQLEIAVTDIPVSGVSINVSELELNAGDTYELDITLSPDGANADDIVWSSSDAEAVSVDNGKLTALASGKSTITVSVDGFTDECVIYVNDELKVGDYMYSDGTYSTCLRDDREPVAIVFWLGDPGKSDASLKKEHPSCSNGLAVALSDCRLTSWQLFHENYKDEGQYYLQGQTGLWIRYNTTYKDNTVGAEDRDMNSISGYNDTKGMEVFNADKSNSNWPVEAVEAVVSYGDECQAPQNTTGWYLPSLKELSLMCSGDVQGNLWMQTDPGTGVRDLINQRLGKIGGSDKLATESGLDSFYWSSQELNDYIAYRLDMSSGTVAQRIKSHSNTIVRAIFAF